MSLNVKVTSCNNNMVFAELGAYPLYTIINARMVSFWSRIIGGKVTKLRYVLYPHSFQLHKKKAKQYLLG